MPSFNDYRYFGSSNPRDGVDLGEFQDTITGLAMKGSSDVFTDWLLPQRKEERQMGQQLLMDTFEPSARMAGMRGAGINPLTAAAGIAGASTSSPQPASSVNPIGDVAGAVGAAATGFGAVSSGVAELSKLAPEIAEINSSAQKNLAAAGLDKVNTDAVITDNKYRDSNWEADLNVKRQSYKNMQQDLSNMMATHRQIMTHCDEMISQIELNGSQKDYYDVMQNKIQEDLRWQKALNDWCLSNKLMVRDSGVDGYIFNMLLNEAPQGDVDSFFNAYYDYCKNRSYATHRGTKDADIDTAFDEEFNKWVAKNSADSHFAKFYADVEVYKDFMRELFKMDMSNPSNIRGFIAKTLNLISNIMGVSEHGKIVSDIEPPKISEPRKSSHQ